MQAQAAETSATLANPPSSQASLDDLADKVWRRLTRKLTAEQERRGWIR